MKLYEEFKEVENLWESTSDWDYADYKDFYKRPFGKKIYQLNKDADLKAWVDANIEFQRKRHPGKYGPGELGSHYSNLNLINSVFNNLIKREQDAGAPLEFLHRLEVLRDTYRDDFDISNGSRASDDSDYDINRITHEIAKACLDKFMEEISLKNSNGGSRLHTHKYWKENNQITSKLNTIEEELVLLGKYLLSSNMHSA